MVALVLSLVLYPILLDRFRVGHSPPVLKPPSPQSSALMREGGHTEPDAGIDLVPVKGGTFEMGDTSHGGSDAKPVHEVTVDDFTLAKNDVTNEQFRRFVDATGYVTTAERVGRSCGQSGDGANDWGDRSGVSWKHPLWPADSIDGKMSHPVVQVSWDDAQAFIKWLNSKTGRQYRLPTEAEWEYAARNGGKNRNFAWGNGNPAGNIADVSAGRKFPSWTIWEDYDDGYVYTSPVGSFLVSELGLFDMTGNVWQWCQDWYGPYVSGAQRNPKGPKSGSGRIYRGGSWYSEPKLVRCATRNFDSQEYRHCSVGFRLAELK